MFQFTILHKAKIIFHTQPSARNLDRSFLIKKNQKNRVPHDWSNFIRSKKYPVNETSGRGILIYLIEDFIVSTFLPIETKNQTFENLSVQIIKSFMSVKADLSIEKAEDQVTKNLLLINITKSQLFRSFRI